MMSDHKAPLASQIKLKYTIDTGFCSRLDEKTVLPKELSIEIMREGFIPERTTSYDTWEEPIKDYDDPLLLAALEQQKIKIYFQRGRPFGIRIYSENSLPNRAKLSREDFTLVEQALNQHYNSLEKLAQLLEIAGGHSTYFCLLAYQTAFAVSKPNQKVIYYITELEKIRRRPYEDGLIAAAEACDKGKIKEVLAEIEKDQKKLDLSKFCNSRGETLLMCAAAAAKSIASEKVTDTIQFLLALNVDPFVTSYDKRTVLMELANFGRLTALELILQYVKKHHPDRLASYITQPDDNRQTAASYAGRLGHFFDIAAKVIDILEDALPKQSAAADAKMSAAAVHK